MAARGKQTGAERLIINSAAYWGVSDRIEGPKTVANMKAVGIPEADSEKIVWDNPVAFFSQSGNMNLDNIVERPSINQTELFDGNSVLRGQTPVVESTG